MKDCICSFRFPFHVIYIFVFVIDAVYKKNS